MKYFTSSNDVAISMSPDGHLSATPRSETSGDSTALMLPVHMEALREFFRAEEDERLGRWRWPENPDYVVYPKEDGLFEVLRESTGLVLTSTVSGNAPFKDEHAQAARAFLAAHPEPKPWHDAKPGEVWALKFGVSDEEVLVQAKDAFFVNLGVDRWFDTTGRRAPEITAGRRIWPEDAS